MILFAIREIALIDSTPSSDGILYLLTFLLTAPCSIYWRQHAHYCCADDDVARQFDGLSHAQLWRARSYQ